jgi:hypothetical protein
LNIRINNFVGAAWRAKAIGLFERETWMLSWHLNKDVIGFAVELSLLVGCGLKTQDFDPSEAWTSSNLTLGHKVVIPTT